MSTSDGAYVVVELVESSDWNSDGERYEYKETGRVFGIFLSETEARRCADRKLRESPMTGYDYNHRKVESP